MLKVYKIYEDAQIPSRGTSFAAGYDLHSYESSVIKNGTRKLFKTGVKLILPLNTYGRISARSSMSLKGIDIGAGVCDADYSGQYHVLLINNSGQDYAVNKGDRIAQLILEKIEYVNIEEINEIDFLSTMNERGNRGTNGFGSTGR